MLQQKDLLPFISQSIPVILIILYLLYPGSFVTASKKTLGKCIAVFLIAIYSYQDVLHGLLMCFIIILYYQDDIETFISRSGENYVEYLPKPSTKEFSAQYENHLEKDFTHIEQAYPDNLPPIRKVGEHLFRKDHCTPAKKVTFKDQHVKNSYITHVYPEVQFRNGDCNPCDKTCHFNVNRKQDIEAELKSKESKGNIVWEMFNAIVFSSGDPVILNDKSLGTKV